MASQRDIKRRIRSIKNLGQITRAMQLVAAARMRKAQERVTASRPYALEIRGIVGDIGRQSGAGQHPLLATRDVRNAGLVFITPDGGLAGALISNLNREALRLVRQQTVPVQVVSVGRKGRGLATRLGWNLIGDQSQMGDNLVPGDVRPIARTVLDAFENGDVDIVHLIYPEFINTVRQAPRTVQLLPVVPPESEDEGDSVGGPWDFEPDNPEAVLTSLLPRYVEFTIYQAILETRASFYSAQMVAMSAATDAANELVKDLSLLANKARQAEITTEISEISGAAEALRTG